MFNFLRTNQTRLNIFLIFGLFLLVIKMYCSFFSDNLILFLMLGAIFIFKIKPWLIYLTALGLILIVVPLLYFSPEERITENLGNLIYLLLIISAVKEGLVILSEKQNQR